jgi:hypothetical protein
VNRCDCAEIAWAAGFFEGEGSFSLAKHRDKLRPQVTMPQSGSPALLERFWLAVGVGSITGPYNFASQTLAKQPKWQYQAYGMKAASVMERLLPYLSGPKRQKYLDWKTANSPVGTGDAERGGTP